ncbi:MAG: hypothetical protein QHG99_08830 [Methanomicrobiales archaeon]|nr:hypothetical protein [Methanomicrobiales archaeon]
MGNETNYNIHGLIKFRIEGDNTKIINHFKEDYAYFVVKDDIEPDFRLIVSDFTLDTNDCYFINYKYYVRENYIACNDGYKIVKWKVAIENIDTKPVIHFSGGMFSEIFLRDYIIEPLIAFLLNQKGLVLLHASSVAYQDKGYIFSATKGTGKTSTLLNLIRDGGIYLSNEPTLLSERGIVYSYPSFIHLYYYNFKSVPFITYKLNTQQKVELYVKHLVHLISLKYVSFSLNINAKTFFGNIGSQYPVKSFILLNKTNKNNIMINSSMKKDELIHKLVIINKFEWEYFSRLIAAYSYVFPKSIVTSFWRKYQEILEKSLEGINIYSIDVPKLYDDETYNEIFKLVKMNEDS